MNTCERSGLQAFVPTLCTRWFCRCLEVHAGGQLCCRRQHGDPPVQRSEAGACKLSGFGTFLSANSIAVEVKFSKRCFTGVSKYKLGVSIKHQINTWFLPLPKPLELFARQDPAVVSNGVSIVLICKLGFHFELTESKDVNRQMCPPERKFSG